MEGVNTDGSSSAPPRCGRYELLVRIGKGGMASVYLARVRGEGGFTRLYALKVLHPHLSGQQEFVDMLMDEAKIAARLHHPNVVSTVDLGRDDDHYFMVMDYVEGVALDRLLRRFPNERPPELILPIAIDALRGLHAAHRLSDEEGHPLDLVHRDVTPGNILVGVDGRGRIADFGVAKARARITKTTPGIVKGKAGYIAPEVVLGKAIDGRADVFSMGVLLWNALTGESLFNTDDVASTLTELLRKEVPPPSTVGLMPPPIFDAPILAALHRDPAMRHESALEMAQALTDAMQLGGRRAEPEQIGEWVTEAFRAQFEKRRGYASSAIHDAWDADQIEPPSTSAMVRKDPSGRIRTAATETTSGVLRQGDVTRDGLDRDDLDRGDLDRHALEHPNDAHPNDAHRNDAHRNDARRGPTRDAVADVDPAPARRSLRGRIAAVAIPVALLWAGLGLAAYLFVPMNVGNTRPAPNEPARDRADRAADPAAAPGTTARALEPAPEPPAGAETSSDHGRASDTLDDRAESNTSLASDSTSSHTRTSSDTRTASDTPPSDTGPASDTPPSDPLDPSLESDPDTRPASDAPPSDTPPSDAPPSDSRPSDTRPSDSRPSDSRPSDTPASDTPRSDTAASDAPSDRPPSETSSTSEESRKRGARRVSGVVGRDEAMQPSQREGDRAP